MRRVVWLALVGLAGCFSDPEQLGPGSGSTANDTGTAGSSTAATDAPTGQSSDGSPSTSTGPAPGTSTGSSETGSDSGVKTECGQCLFNPSNRCQAAFAACSEDEMCAALLDCVGGCPIDDLSGCATRCCAMGDPGPAWNPYVECLQSCADECPGAPDSLTCAG